MPPKITILLSTYNGEKFLAEQLDSLINQTYKNLIIVVRDDGSSDRTLKIIHDYQLKFPDLFHIIDNDGRNLGAGISYSFLIDYVLAHKTQLGLERTYIMFCDQDDVWTPDKVALQMQSMKTAEDENGTIPALVHSDLRVVSDTGHTMAASFMKYQGLEPEQNRFGQLLFCNLVTGCTVLINESLATRSQPVPAQAVMHDWWLALVASAFGKLIYIDRPLVAYRQHSANEFGAIEKKSCRSFRDVSEKLRHIQPESSLYQAAIQAKVFLKQYRKVLHPRQKIRLRLTSVLRTRSGIAQKAFRWLGRRL